MSLTGYARHLLAPMSWSERATTAILAGVILAAVVVAIETIVHLTLIGSHVASAVCA